VAEVIWDKRNPLSANLADVDKQVIRKLDAVLEFQEPAAQNSMRLNASWTDRTGNARQGLFAQRFVSGDDHGLVLYHTVSYGIYLETSNSAQYEIIMPTVHSTAHNVIDQLRGILNRDKP
jgi:hypothetical protein